MNYIVLDTLRGFLFQLRDDCFHTFRGNDPKDQEVRTLSIKLLDSLETFILNITINQKEEIAQFQNEKDEIEVTKTAYDNSIVKL